MTLQPFKDYLSINLGQKAASDYYNQIESFFRQYPEFTQENINQYLASKVNVWNAGSTNQFYLAVKWYSKFVKVPIELPKMKKYKRKPRAYLQEKVVDEILLKTPLLFRDSFKAKLILELLFKTGMRPKELLTLQRKNIDLDNLKIILLNTKTAISKVIPITKDLASNIKVYFGQEAEGANAFNLKRATLRYYFQVISREFNIKTTPYQMRHSFSHNFLKRNGNNLIALSKMLGHSSIETTKIYSDIDEQELQDVYNKAFEKKGKKK